jgi:hypothetical protein
MTHSKIQRAALAACTLLLLGGHVAVQAADSVPSGSTWTQTGADVFKTPEGFYRSQGMATDGTNFFFSWQFGLQKTDSAYNVLANNSSFSPFSSGIPSSLSALGYNHIGDIDTANGIIYASLDSSSSGYNTPAVALYNASDLSYTGTYYTITAPHGTHDIASWFAVDASQGLAYGMAYGNATEMAVYNLSDWSFSHYISLDKPLDQVQGGKIYGDWMYMASDDASRSVYRTNLLDGTVETLFTLKQPYDQEVEGLSITDGANGPVLNVLVINDPDNSGQDLSNPNLNVTLYHYSVAAVPEPGTYALMLAGLGAIGVSVRRRARR